MPPKKDRFNFVREARQPKDARETDAVTEPEIEAPEVQERAAAPSLNTIAFERTVPRRQGRMQQEREQLNVRLPQQLKRRAAAQAALEGITVGELIERLLVRYLAPSDAE